MLRTWVGWLQSLEYAWCDFKEDPQWSHAIFPNFDGSPYYSIAVDRSDLTGDTAYAGNTRLYKTTDSGRTWDRVFNTDTDELVAGFNTGRGHFSAIEAYGDTVYAGYYVPGEPSSEEGGARGFLIYSGDGGETWSLVDSSALTNINDLHLYEGDPGEVDVLIAATPTIGGTGYIIHVEGNEVIETFEFENGSISDLSDDEDTLFAIVNDVSSGNAPTLYYAEEENERLGEFTVMSTDGLPEQVFGMGNARLSLRFLGIVTSY